MTVILLPQAEDDLAEAFDYYEAARPGLGSEFVTEFRHSVEKILQYPRGWQVLDDPYRRCRLHRFPYGVIYRIDEQRDEIVVVAVMHLARHPGRWRRRTG
jgi:toxin ParE2